VDTFVYPGVARVQIAAIPLLFLSQELRGPPFPAHDTRKTVAVDLLCPGNPGTCAHVDSLGMAPAPLIHSPGM
jgi:hypothetical protein